MSETKALYLLQRLIRKYKLTRVSEVLLTSLSLTFILFSVPYSFNLSPIICIMPALIAGILLFIYRCKTLHLFNLKPLAVPNYLNQHYSELQNSTDLLLAESKALTSLQQLQRQKAISVFEDLYPRIQLPNRLLQASGLFFISIILSLTIASFSPLSLFSTYQNSALLQKNSNTSAELPPVINALKISIIPPRYTGLKPFNSTNCQLTIPEHSTIRWDFNFTTPVKKCAIIFSGKDSVKIPVTAENGYTLTKELSEDGFYQVVWVTTTGENKNSDYYKIEIIKDEPPSITINGLNQFTELEFSQRLNINLSGTLTDDYSISHAQIIATVSKGSGESVKFREENLSFDKPVAFTGKHVDASRTLDLIKLGMNPGDELYFYVVAFDNKQPQSNRARTETYFISIPDTTRQETVIDEGLGVDVMPDYFRSQRQIIIDSEKLLKEKKHISKEAFTAGSNGLAHDQKVLRLRYGEFLGEEFESGIGPQGNPAEVENQQEEDVTKKYGHVHDKENEHNLVQEKAAEHDHSHATKTGEDSKNEVPKEFIHEHDRANEATFFTQSIRAKLKAALTIMWDAELHLRLYDPAKSLPFQYKALKLLKEISQDSRIYVHRTGFDPPPLKEEKRMTGDISGVHSSSTQDVARNKVSYPYIRKALQAIALEQASSEPVFSEVLKKSLSQAGNELGQLAITQPGSYLKSLSMIRAVVANEISAKEKQAVLKDLQAAFWRAVPATVQSPMVSTKAFHTLDASFIKKMKQHE